MLKLNHKELDVWQLSITLTTKLYNLTEKFPNSELYGLTSQLRRAAVSVSSNIAEGSSRKSKAERIRFFEIARSSIVEIDTQLELAKVLNYFKSQPKSRIMKIEKTMNSLFAMLTKLKVKTN